MLKKSTLFTKLLTAVMTIFMVMLPAMAFSCAASNTLASDNQNATFNSLLQNKYLTARFYGLMTFDFNGEIFAWPTELAISSVPLVWMGQVFNGKIEVNGLTDQVHGAISADGEWLLNLSYSRTILGSTSRTSYSLTLKNVPLIGTTANKPISGSFEKKGDVQKYIETIEYQSKALPGFSPENDAKYISTDWSNSSSSVPALKITFEVDPSQLYDPSAPAQGMGM